MAQIMINEISDNYTFNTGTGAFATVALPITAAWGPAYLDPITVYGKNDVESMLEDTQWLHFPATQEGLESFVSTYRGPSSNFKIKEDYSYQVAMTLLTAGYDVLVCRVCQGACASTSISFGSGKSLSIKAKYPGSFGNNLNINITKLTYTSSGTDHSYYNAIVYVKDPNTGSMTAVENLAFTFGYNDADIPTLGEIKSNFVTFSNTGISDGDSVDSGVQLPIALANGTDTFSPFTAVSTKFYAPLIAKPDDWDTGYANYFTFTGSAYTAVSAASVWGTTVVYKQCDTETAAIVEAMKSLATERYKGAYEANQIRLGANTPDSTIKYISVVSATGITDKTKLYALYDLEWTYNAAFYVYQILKDKLNYNPNRIISTWDDQNIKAFGDFDFSSSSGDQPVVSPLHKIIMDTAFYSRCATGMIDLPKALPKNMVYTSSDFDGYVQKLSAETLPTGENSNNAVLYNTNSAVFGPWATYRLVSMQKMVYVSPSFLELLIHRAQVLNQATQYEWILPTNKNHNLKIGETQYTVSTKLLNQWQKVEGVGVNVITKIPDLGTNVWGNSTLFNVPPATYQALANLSTRWLMNAIEDVVYRCGIAITFQYNVAQSYSSFYAGVSPLLDTMVNVGAIESYKIKMSADVNGLDQVNANSVIGKIWITPVGSISDITVDLIALPQGTDLGAFGS